MGEKTSIGWTDHTFQPWIGCSRVSPGCENCYAEKLAKARFEGPPGKKLPLWGVDAARRPMAESYWAQPLRWNRAAERAGRRRRVFCASLADVFEMANRRNEEAHRVMRSGRSRLFRLIEKTPWLDWLLLTKRPENVVALVPWGCAPGSELGPWPANVWLGVTAEDQKRADERVPILMEIPAAVRFVSHEPALEVVDFSPWLPKSTTEPCHFVPFSEEAKRAYGAEGPRTLTRKTMGLDWVITGGESGPRSRPYAVEWARSVVEQCRGAGAAAFVKQLGSNPISTTIVTGLATRLAIRHSKGEDITEFPEDLRVREWPRSAEVP